MRRFSPVLVAAFLATTAAAQPKFSQPHGLYDGGTLVVYITSDSGADIHYTTDGSTPTAASRLYSTPLTVNRTTILRAVEVVGDSISPVATASYIFVHSVLSQSNTPAGYPTEWGAYCQIAGTAIADYEMDPEMTSDATLRPQIIEGLRQLPILSIVSDKGNFFSKERDEERGGIYIFTGPPVGDGTGHGWTRPASVELFGGPQEHDYSGGCGVRLHGGHGRLAEKNPKHSFRLVFKKEYGKKTMKYPVFGEDEPAQFDQLVVRCHFGYTWYHWDNTNRQRAQYTRDVWTRRMQRKMGDTSVNALYVHLFLNGMYWGLYNISERVDDQFGKNHLGAAKSDIDVIKVEEEGGNHIEASEGTMEAWNQMLATAAAVGSEPDDEAYARLDTLLDIDHFIDYMIINQYAGNTDWDHHNWYAIRRHNNEESVSEGFRFLCWDSELVLLNVNENLANGSSNNGIPTTLFRQLLGNDDFARRYVRRAKQLLSDDGLLGETSVVQVWDSLYNTIDKALYDEAARWGDYRRDVHPWQSRGQLYTVEDYYLPERNRLLTTYFPYRTDIVLNQILAHVDIDDFEAPDDWLLMASDMFYDWDGTGGDAQAVGNCRDAEVHLKSILSGGGVVAGLSSVSEYKYADITEYDKLVIRGSGNLRILVNRQNNQERTWKELQVSVNENSPYWDSEYGCLIIPLTDLKDRLNNKGAAHDEDYIHLNAIKVNWNASALVKGLYLVPKSDDTSIAANSFRSINDGRYYNLSGQVVDRPTKGIYIRNGKKIVVK